MKVNSIAISIALSLSFLVLAACAPGPAPSQEKPSAVPASSFAQATAKEAWEEKWENLVKAAQKEGKIVIYTSEGTDTRTALSQNFKKKYGIDVEMVTGRSPELMAKLTNERRAGLYIVDAFVSGIDNMINTLKPLALIDLLEPEFMLPELVDPLQIEKLWFEGRLAFVDRATRTILSFAGYVTVPFAINTELVKPGEIKSYKDLLQPKWKGKISINDPTLPGAGGKWFGIALWAKFVDQDYMRSLARQEPAALTDTRLQVDWLAKGKYPLAIAPKTGVFTDYVKARAPVQHLPAPVEGAYLSSGGGNISLLKDRPHPHAAKLYLNWLLSHEGQTAFSLNSGRQSLRLDVTTEHISPEQMRQPGTKYIRGDDEGYFHEQEKYFQLAKEIFGPYVR